MSYSPCIAVVGKGGVGKTTLAAFTLRYLLESGVKPILAVDADPSVCFSSVLGVSVVETIGGIREDTRSIAKGIPEGIPKQQYLELKVQEAVTEADGFDLLTMGRPEGPGCYCFVNNVLRDYLDRLTRTYRAVVMDCEAGLEHLSRRTSRDVNIMILVADPTVKALTTLQSVLGISQDLNNKIERKLLVLNRVPRGSEDKILRAASEKLPMKQFEAVAVIPQDEAIFEAELAGENLLRSRKNFISYLMLKDFFVSLKQPIVK